MRLATRLPATLTAHAASAALRAGDTCATELTEAYLARIAAEDGAVRAYLTVTADVARRQAAEADRRRAAGEDGPLLGVPYALKDNITTAGITTTAGSRALADYVPPDSATVVRRLRAAGAVLLGKLNLDEFGMGSSNESSAFFATRNPWDLTRVPGGSSGGAAAAVAAGLCAFAVGTDTGGSIRQPAALCGVVGLRPTYGRVSRYGLVAFASSLDQAGPITRDVRDAALVLGAMAGRDPADATSVVAPASGDLTSALEPGPVPLAGVRVGVPGAVLGAGLEDGVRGAVESALATLEALGATRVDVQLPHVTGALAAYYLVAAAEASTNLARYDGLRYGLGAGSAELWARIRRARGDGFGPEVKRRIMMGTYALSAGYREAFYGRAARMRGLVRADFEAALANCDVVAGPTSPSTAFRLGSRVDDPLAMYGSDVHTVPASLAGLPAVSVPCGLAGGLPVGLQLAGRPFGEAALLRVAAAFEAATGMNLRPPSRGDASATGPRP